MGKRSRSRSGPVKGVKDKPASSPVSASHAPDAGPVERAKASWKAAGELGPGIISEPGQKPRAVMRNPSLAGAGAGRASGGREAAKAARKARREAKPERPAALWGRAPISEFAIAVGLILLAVGLAQGPGSIAISGGLIFISIAAIEFAGREHVRGYRSHTLFLAMMIVVALHLGIALIVGAHTARGPAFIAGDVILFGLLASGLHKQYSIARLQAAPTRTR